MRKKVTIIAPTGMLGNMIYGQLKHMYDLILVYKNERHLQLLDEKYGGVSTCKTVKVDLADLVIESNILSVPPKSDTSKKIYNILEKSDYIINCAGVINKHTHKNPCITAAVNSIFPYLLGRWFPQRVIHFSTDCVFDGKKGTPYTEHDIPTPVDLYGLTKLYGEKNDTLLVFRSSFIGPELYTHESLHDWLLRQEDKSVTGYTNHYWSGVTTKQMALLCKAVIDGNSPFPSQGLFHIFSNGITKYELLLLLKKKYSVSVTITEGESELVDRRLASVYPFTSQLQIPTIQEMVDGL